MVGLAFHLVAVLVTELIVAGCSERRAGRKSARRAQREDALASRPIGRTSRFERFSQGQRPAAIEESGRYWARTSDLHRVEVAL